MQRNKRNDDEKNSVKKEKYFFIGLGYLKYAGKKKGENYRTLSSFYRYEENNDSYTSIYVGMCVFIGGFYVR